MSNNYAWVYKHIKAQQALCFYCEEPLSLKTVTRDHLYPRSLVSNNEKRYKSGITKMHWKGDYGMRNSVFCHRKCNQVKSTRLPTRAEVLKYKEIYGKIPKYVYFGTLD